MIVATLVILVETAIIAILLPTHLEGNDVKLNRVLVVLLLGTLAHLIYLLNKPDEIPCLEIITPDLVEHLISQNWACSGANTPEPIGEFEVLEPAQPLQVEKEVIPLDSEDEEVLLNIAMAEAEGEGIEGKALVMRVILNRKESEEFPDTIREVVFQENQFSPVASGVYGSKEPDRECYTALELVRNGEYLDMPALFFDSCEGSWASKNRTFLYRMGNHNFYE